MNGKKMQINNSILNYSYNLVVYICDTSEYQLNISIEKKNYNEELFTTVDHHHRNSYFLL